jgi:hypothetical protein
MRPPPLIDFVLVLLGEIFGQYFDILLSIIFIIDIIYLNKTIMYWRALPELQASI